MRTPEYDIGKNERLAAIGQRIKAIRGILRLSQREMAVALNTSASYLSEIEGGKANPGPGFFLDLSAVYDVSIEYVFHGNGEMFYDPKTRLPRTEFKDIGEIDSLEKLFWLMNCSAMFKNTMLGYAAKFFMENETIIKKNLRKDDI